jgi:hypothetical protein
LLLGITYCETGCIWLTTVFFNNTYGLYELLQLNLQRVTMSASLKYGTCHHLSKCLDPKLSHYNDEYRKIFRFNRWESVSEFIDGMGYLNVTHCWYLSIIKFLKCASCSLNTVLLSVYRLYVHSTECINLLSTFDMPLNASVYILKRSTYVVVIN